MVIKDPKGTMIDEFERTYLGLIRYFLKIQVKQKHGDIFISEEKYAYDLLTKFNMSNYKASPMPKYDSKKKANETTYRKLGGSLMCSTQIMLDIAFKIYERS